jgi:hypothetical protein
MWALAQEHFPELLRDPGFPRFIEHVQARRMSKQGRFIRVHLKTGARATWCRRAALRTGWN